MYKSKLLYGGGNVILNSSPEVVLIEITYKGDASLHPELGRNWTINYNSSKIIMLNHKPSNLKNGIILKYRGEFIPVGCKLIDMDNNKSFAIIKTQDVHFWQKINSNWETSDKYTKYKNTYKYKTPIKGVRNG